MNCHFCGFETESPHEFEGNQLCDLCHGTVPEGFLKIKGSRRDEDWRIVRVMSLQNNLIIALLKEISS